MSSALMPKARGEEIVRRKPAGSILQCTREGCSVRSDQQRGGPETNAFVRDGGFIVTKERADSIVWVDRQPSERVTCKRRAELRVLTLWLTRTAIHCPATSEMGQRVMSQRRLRRIQVFVPIIFDYAANDGSSAKPPVSALRVYESSLEETCNRLIRSSVRRSLNFQAEQIQQLASGENA